MATEPLVLIVDDEEALRETLAMRIESWGFRTATAADVGEALARAADAEPALVVSDVKLPDGTGIELLAAMRERGMDVPVVLITAYGTVDRAVEAMKLGARDFLTKPVDHDQLQAVIEDALRHADRQGEARKLETALEEGAGFGRLVGTSKIMRKLYQELELLAQSDASAILTGESGTGKELAAATVHEQSSRADGPFVAVNCAAIPESLVESELFGHEKGAFTGATNAHRGCFERARGGTLLLDEIGEMPVALQPKLLRVLEERTLRRVGGSREIETDVRVLAATNRDPQQAVKNGELREDLFYRLNVFTVELPPLRARMEDLPLLAQHFIRRGNRRHDLAVEGVSDDAMDTLRGYGWPGNVRELSNALERAAIVARDGWIETVHLPPFLTARDAPASEPIKLPVNVSVAEAEKIVILETLKRVDNNKTEAARRLGVDVKTVRNKLKAYGLMD